MSITLDQDGNSVIVPRLLTLHEAAELVGLKHLALRRAIQRGELPAIKLCSRLRIEARDLASWIERNRLPASDTRSGP